MRRVLVGERKHDLPLPRNGSTMARVVLGSQEDAAMMGDTTIRDETRDKVRKLCAEAGLPDKVPELATEEAAQAFIEHLESRMQQRAPDTI
jgi:hypothetical protein